MDRGSEAEATGEPPVARALSGASGSQDGLKELLDRSTLVGGMCLRQSHQSRRSFGQQTRPSFDSM
ncbi:plasma membrane H(+)ATPase [Aspergillus luchuensis]|uniref:Plasma membrane H(+)ATPase n=1 Tax=Aspergillus kawachii TaxID=1069201 RepID=A0A146FVZ9_ASPKA|nr:plasma membrane H(+)ATPase [Aspergillus luchuensis]